MNKLSIIALTAGLLFTSCNEQKSETKSTPATAITAAEEMVQLTPEQAKNAGIVTGVATQREMHKTLKVSGVIDVPPQNMISVSIPISGYLKKTSLLPGQKVRKGEVLATMEDQQYIQLQQDCLTAQSRLTYYEADYNRQQKLNDTKASSDKVFQQAKSDYESQRVLVRSISEKLLLIGINPAKLNVDNISRSISIYAPISGYVTKVNVNIGKYVNPTDVLFELVNPDNLHLSLTVFENDAANLIQEQKVVCYTNTHPEVKYDATIHLINPSIGKERTTEVHCHLTKIDKSLMPGMFMNAEIELHNAQVQALPEEAVVKWNNLNYIFTEEAPNKYKLLQVETGAADNGFVEIKTKLPEGKIVTKSAYTLLTKMKNSGEE